MRTLHQHLRGPGPKRILSLDGGGVRGLITLGLLDEVENILRARVPHDNQSEFRLCHYFDLIGGTSTGGIIASLLALGWTVAEVREAYFEICPRVFKKQKKLLDTFLNPYNVFAPGFDASEFKAAVDDIIRKHLKKVGRVGMLEPTLGSDLLLTGLALFSKRIDSGSVWALTNSPRAKYWHPDLTEHWEHKFDHPTHKFHANCDYPLSILARGTASAPFLLEAVELSIDPRTTGVFLDGGASPFNCPALELFQIATLRQFDEKGDVVKYSPYGFDWETGKDQLLLYSLGTGSWRSRMSAEDYRVKKNWEQAKIALLSMIDDCMKSSITWLQALSEPVDPVAIDGNLEHMRGLRVVRDPLLHFQRVNVTLDAGGLAPFELKGLTEKVIENTRGLDNAARANLDRLDAIGIAAGKRLVKPEHFPAVFDPVYA